MSSREEPREDEGNPYGYAFDDAKKAFDACLQGEGRTFRYVLGIAYKSYYGPGAFNDRYSFVMEVIPHLKRARLYYSNEPGETDLINEYFDEVERIETIIPIDWIKSFEIERKPFGKGHSADSVRIIGESGITYIIPPRKEKEEAKREAEETAPEKPRKATKAAGGTGTPSKEEKPAKPPRKKKAEEAQE